MWIELAYEFYLNGNSWSLFFKIINFCWKKSILSFFVITLYIQDEKQYNSLKTFFYIIVWFWNLNPNFRLHSFYIFCLFMYDYALWSRTDIHDSYHTDHHTCFPLVSLSLSLSILYTITVKILLNSYPPRKTN